MTIPVAMTILAQTEFRKETSPLMIEEVGIVLAKVHTVYGCYKTLQSFVDDEMGGFLRELGELHYDSAIQHLENGQRSRVRRKDYILLAIGDLENAYRQFEASAPTGFDRWLREFCFAFGGHKKRVFGGHKKRAQAYGWACATAALQSICYKYLTDRVNEKVYLERASRCFDEYADAARMWFYLENTSVYATLPEFTGTPPVVVPGEEEIRKFDDRIKKQRAQLQAITV